MTTKRKPRATARKRAPVRRKSRYDAPYKRRVTSQQKSRIMKKAAVLRKQGYNASEALELAWYREVGH